MTYTIAVIGLGKIGLALAAQYATSGSRVIGCDIQADLVRSVNQGQVPPHSEPGLAERVDRAVGRGLLCATTNTPEAVSQSNVVVVIVPLIVDTAGNPDFGALDSATRSVAEGLRPGSLVVYETTLPMGTTRTRFGPMLEQSGLRMQADFDVAFSPERVLVGRTFEDLVRYPKVVGGVNQHATDRAAEFYREVLGAEILVMPNADTAEFVKLAETTYRDVNIGLANELATFAEARGIDAVAAFRAANTQPYSHLHQPGVGVGGHCIPVYPRFLLSQAQVGELDIVRRARDVNDGMAMYTVGTLESILGDLAGKSVLILGLAYRGGQKEASFSSALLLISALKEKGARPFVHDPLFSPMEISSFGVEPACIDGSTPMDAIIVQTDHPEYRELDWARFTGSRVVVDGRNILNASSVTGTGMTYVGIGRGSTSP